MLVNIHNVVFKPKAIMFTIVIVLGNVRLRRYFRDH